LTQFVNVLFFLNITFVVFCRFQCVYIYMQKVGSTIPLMQVLNYSFTTV